jgi:hypothetical protein
MEKEQRAMYKLARLCVNRRRLGLTAIGLLVLISRTTAQAPAQGQAVGTMPEIMVSMVHPAANAILLAAARGGPQNEKEWVAVKNSAVLLAESGNVLMMRGHARDQGEWLKDAQLLVDAGSAAADAARSKDTAALVTVGASITATCTTCHKQYRPNVHPPQP